MIQIDDRPRVYHKGRIRYSYYDVDYTVVIDWPDGSQSKRPMTEMEVRQADQTIRVRAMKSRTEAQMMCEESKSADFFAVILPIITVAIVVVAILLWAFWPILSH